jgi:NADPH:quinone reductase-like Zn-dependent oxidoreductase
MRAIQITATGGPEVLTPVELPGPTPGPGQVLVAVAAAGINYADTHIADGSYLSTPPLPYVPGNEVIGHTAEGYAERVVEANRGRRVDVVLDAVGGAVFDAALAAVAPFGRLVTFGAASRQAPHPVDPVRLMRRNLAVVGFWLAPVLGMPGCYAPPLADLLALVADGRLRPIVGGEYPLAEARRAHEDMLARRTTGKLILRP